MARPRRTRELLGAALKEELRSTPLDKVTVTALTTKVGVTRQTFYNHFLDVRDLAVWVFETEFSDHVMAHASYEAWSQGFASMLTYMRDNRDQTYAVTNSLSHRDLETFLFRALREMMSAIVAELEAGLVVHAEDRAFVIDHYTLSVLGHLQRWLSTGMADDPHVLADRVERVLRGSVRTSLTRFAVPAPGCHVH